MEKREDKKVKRVEEIKEEKGKENRGDEGMEEREEGGQRHYPGKWCRTYWEINISKANGVRESSVWEPSERKVRTPRKYCNGGQWLSEGENAFTNYCREAKQKEERVEAIFSILEVS